MKRLFIPLILASLLLSSFPARADPIVTPLIAFASTALGSALVNIGISVAVSYGLTMPRDRVLVPAAQRPQIGRHALDVSP